MMLTARERLRALTARMRLPLIAAPMFLVSGPDLARAVRRAGVVGAIPFPNARKIETLEAWLDQACRAEDEDGAPLAPFAANVVTHRSYDRLPQEVELIARYKPEIVITALGGPQPVIEAVHGYAGLVFADVNSVAFARKAVDAGADGLALISSGAGGHTGSMSAPAFVAAVRAFFDGPVILGGGLANGEAVRAAEILGADLAYMGTPFIAASESMAADDYKDMVVAAEFEDLVMSNVLTGAYAYYLKASLQRMGLDPGNPGAGHGAGKHGGGPDFARSQDQVKAWRDVWSAGHGVGSVRCVEPAADIVARIEAGYRAGVARPAF